MSYKQKDSQRYQNANQNLIFHCAEPEERWCFPRSHLVHAAAGADCIEFRFPVYRVTVELADAEKILQLVLQGADSVFVQAGAPDGSTEKPPIEAERIVIESLDQDEY